LLQKINVTKLKLTKIKISYKLPLQHHCLLMLLQNWVGVLFLHKIPTDQCHKA